MKKYIKSDETVIDWYEDESGSGVDAYKKNLKQQITSATDLELDRASVKEIESGLYSIVRRYFHDDTYSCTEGMKLSESAYDILRYTVRPYSGYRNTSAKPEMSDDREELNEFKSQVRKFLKQFGATRIKFDTRKFKRHYGYVSGPDDFPVICLCAIYFN